MPGPIAFIPGKPADPSSPFGRFLPLIPAGTVSAWLDKFAAPGEWILEPFGASPDVIIEAARAGYRVLVAANNPVARFLLEMAADPPSEADLKAALAGLAASTKGSQRLEPHLRSLYLTHCAQCGREIEAEAFLWEKDAPTPYGRLYTCPYCGDSGEHPTTEEDAQRAAQYTSRGLHWSRALERVAPLNDPDRAHAEEALDAYLPRAVYALFTLINKLDQMAPSPAALGDRTDWEDRQRLMEALVLSACDQANNLWPYPQARARPRQLSTPTRFREKNVWLALEEAVLQWARPETETDAPVPLCIWPDQPPAGGGICLFEGRLKTLSESLDDVHLSAVLAALPRPNQAYWTLSALWAGWLWGREFAASFKSVLRRRRYDWGWHTAALHAALGNLSTQQKGIPVLAITGEAEPGLISAALISARMAGLGLQSIALRVESDEAQILWELGTHPEIIDGGRRSRKIASNHPAAICWDHGRAKTVETTRRTQPLHSAPFGCTPGHFDIAYRRRDLRICSSRCLQPYPHRAAKSLQLPKWIFSVRRQRTISRNWISLAAGRSGTIYVAKRSTGDRSGASAADPDRTHRRRVRPGHLHPFPGFGNP